ncbi:MAG: serine/threonine protein kinase [Planctomycetes bacterium]|nr:serine/threonine protein kinase [Planctomycetota bacterium]
MPETDRPVPSGDSHEPTVQRCFIDRLPVEDGKTYVPGTRILIERVISVRPLGAVIQAFHTGLDAPVTLRVMNPTIRDRLTDAHAFYRWVRKMARVRHPTMAAIYDLGHYDGYPYLVIGPVEGVPLCERTKERPFTQAEAVNLLAPVADGLAAYWRQGLLHRGVSPRRIVIAPDGVPVLDLVVLPTDSPDDFVLDAHAPFMAGFWSPEELEHRRDLDARSDMFSFGASLYFAVTGTTPWGEGTPAELFDRTLKQDARDVRKHCGEIHPDLCSFVGRCLKRDPAKRFESPKEFLDAVRRLQVTVAGEAPGVGTSGLRRAVRPKPGTRTIYSAGDVLGNCLLKQEVGSGAFGIVYRARHRVLDIAVAVKLLPLDVAEQDPQFVPMFLREARTAARIRHPNVIAIFEAGEQSGQHYLVMEYAPNGSVLDLLNERGGKLKPREALPILLAAARGLAAAEQLRIVHRDIKPENMMFGSDNVLKIADLGLAKRLPGEGDAGTMLAGAKRDQLTEDPTKVIGTPAYMAPEVALDPAQVDGRADQYSLGVTAFQVLTGVLPFEGKTSLETIMKHVKDPVPDPLEREPGIPRPLGQIVTRLMEKNPADRYESASKLVEALERISA